MAEQALRTQSETSNEGQAPAIDAANSAKSLVVKNELPTPAIAAKSIKSINDSVTYQNNRKSILATLQSLQNNMQDGKGFQPLGKPNMLHDRFEIDVNQPLPQYSRTHAKAYFATDLQQPDKLCLGLVVEPYFPHRHGLIEALIEALKNPSQGQEIKHLSSLLDAGVVNIEAWNEGRMVLFYEQPKGVKLSEILAQQQFYSQTDALKQLTDPIVSVITKLHSLGVLHGGISPQNIFIHEKNLTLWDCAAQPCGYDNIDIYEPIERLSATTFMRGEPTLESDIYATVILTLEACGMLESKKQFTALQLYPAYLQKGVYNVLVDETAITSSQMIDLVRAVLGENPKERWGLEQINSFIGGKRYNLIPVGAIKETNRSFSFITKDYVTLRSLAFAYANNWEQALSSIRDIKLVKWLDTLVQKSDVKEKIERMNQRAIRSPSVGKSADEIISKTISSLDPFGAIRTKQMAVVATAMGQALSAAFKSGDLTQQINIREIIDAELVGFWRDLSPYNSAQLKWNPEQMRFLLQSASLGFGMERVLYELNPTMPCMSRTYARYHSLSAKHLMRVLESLAKDHADDKLYDKHMLAFLAARAGINKDMQVKDFRGYAQLQSSTELQTIMLLAAVQEKLKIDFLPALSCWAALKIAEMVEQFHGLDVRQSISRDMQAVLPRGKLTYLLRVLHNKEYITRDTQGHSKAVQVFVRNSTKIKYYKDKTMIANKAEESGQKFALSLSLIMLIISVYVVMMKYLV